MFSRLPLQRASNAESVYNHNVIMADEGFVILTLSIGSPRIILDMG